MALLQISEPGLAPDPHQRRLAVGIDLGTTHSLVATVKSGVAECLPDIQGRVLLPSVVRYLPEGGRQIGYEALAQQTFDPANTIGSAKRFMGRARADIAYQEQLPYALLEQAGLLRIQTRAGAKTAVEVSAEILATLRQRAEDSLGDELFGAVITVPAYFDDAQRQATKDAARLAGLNVLRLLNEPTAAVVAYGLDNASEGVYAIYDLGGGTFDISILRLTRGVFEVIATGGDSALGGDDYDRALAQVCAARLGLLATAPSAGEGAVEGAGAAATQTPTLSGADWASLSRAARAAKEQLSEQAEVLLSVEVARAKRELRLSRAEFEQASAGLTARTLTVVRQTLQQAALTPTDLQGVVLVGGATRMPQIHQAVAGFFGQAPLTNLNPDEVVALGAAIQADQLAGNRPDADVLLLDVCPLSLGLETMGGLVERIIARNETIPTARAQDFTTFQDGQTALALHVVQGERDLASDCRSLARFELRGIPPMAAGAARIRVTYTLDADGLLSVSAQELGSGVQAQVNVKPSYGLSDDEIATMLQQSFATAHADVQTRALVQARVDGQRLLVAVQSALRADGELLDATERISINALLDTLQHALEHGQDAATVETATQALADGTEAFAAQRMNRSIAQALTGRAVETL